MYKSPYFKRHLILSILLVELSDRVPPFIDVDFNFIDVDYRLFTLDFWQLSVFKNCLSLHGSSRSFSAPLFVFRYDNLRSQASLHGAGFPHSQDNALFSPLFLAAVLGVWLPSLQSHFWLTSPWKQSFESVPFLPGTCWEIQSPERGPGLAQVLWFPAFPTPQLSPWVPSAVQWTPSACVFMPVLSVRSRTSCSFV